MSSRAQSMSKPPVEGRTKPSCKIHSLAIVAEKVQIIGERTVEIGENTVLHPYSKIVVEGGDVVIGSYCSINEKAVVGITDGSAGDVVIGDEVNIETGATVQARSIGNGTVIEVGAKIGKGAVIGKYCKITPLEEVRPHEQLADYTVVYSDNRRRIDQTMRDHAEVREAKQKGQIMHLELLKKLMPDSSAKWH